MFSNDPTTYCFMLVAASVLPFHKGSQESHGPLKLVRGKHVSKWPLSWLIFYCPLDIIYSHLGRGNTIKELSRPDWPVVISVMVLIDDGCWEGPVHTTSSTILCLKKSAEHKPVNQSAIFLDGF